MALGFTDYLEGKIIDLTLRGQAFSAPTTVWVALHTAAPSDASPSTGEVAGNGYARVAITATTANWTAHGASGPADNGGAITFPACSTAQWGSVTHASIWDANAAGNCLYVGALTVAKTVGVGDTFSFATGAFDITLD